jgi:hypothetical protein
MLVIASAAMVLLGRGLQHLFWDAPYRSLLWDQAILERPLSWLGISWQNYVQNLAMESAVNGMSTFLGICSISLSTICVWIVLSKRTLSPPPRWIQYAFYTAGAWLVCLSALYFKAKGFRIGQFIEYASQVLSPLAVVWLLQGKRKLLSLAFPIAISFTFLGHGLYALGYYPQPGHFVDMTISILGVSEDSARNILRLAGVFDLLAAVLIFVPQFRKPAIIFCVFWGTLTAFARVVSGIDFSQFLNSVFYYLPSTIYRLPHGLIPLAYWYFLEAQRNPKISSQTSDASS